MTTNDRLREAIKQVEVRGAQVASQAAKDGIGTDLVVVLDAAREHLSCGDLATENTKLKEAAQRAIASAERRGTITDEMVERAARVIYQGTYQGHRNRQGLLDHTRAALVAALGKIDTR